MVDSNKYITYLDSLLKNFPAYSLNNQDDKEIEKLGLNIWITKKLTRNNFRRGKLKEVTENKILEKVTLSLKENIPLYLIACFGGYKHFWNPSYPEIDWAEFFNMAFMREYLAPIISVYKPGVILEYESEDIQLTYIDNYPKESLDRYCLSFRKLLENFNSFQPNNLNYRLIRCQEQYDPGKLLERITELIPQKRKIWENLSEEDIKIRTHRTPANIMWKGEKDLSSISEDEKKKYIIESKIFNDTFYDADFELRPNYFEGENHIPFVFTFGLGYENVGDWLILGSSRSSFVDFWPGRGIIEERTDRLIPRIVSQQQYLSVKDKLLTVPIENPILENFKNIEIYQGIFN
jgi:hypothetical protein